MTMRRTSQAIAMSLRGALYLASKGAMENTYPNGPGTRPVLAPVPEDVRRKYAGIRKALLTEWRTVDIEGWRLWRNALVIVRRHEDEPLSGWSEMVYEESGLRLADPCRYCRECRGRK